MTDDPITTLEQQLRGAVRRRRRHRLRQRGALALVAALVLGGGVAAASQLLGSDTQSAADRAIAAGQTAAIKQAACATQGRRGEPRMVSDPLPTDVTHRLGVFRRAATQDDHTASRYLGLGGVRVLARSLRVAKAADGSRFAMAVSYGRLNLPGTPIDQTACLRATLREALAQPEASNPGVRTEINAKLGGQIRRAQALIDGTAHFLTIMTLDPRGRALGGGGTILHDGKIPAFASIGPVRHGRERRIEVTGLVPDGIHDVRLIDSAGPKAQRVPPRVVTIRDNVYHAALPRKAGPRISVQWRTRNGQVVRTTHLVY